MGSPHACTKLIQLRTNNNLLWLFLKLAFSKKNKSKKISVVCGKISVVWKAVLKLALEIHAWQKVVQLHTRQLLFIIEVNCVYFCFVISLSQTKDHQLQFIAFLGPIKYFLHCLAKNYT